MAKPLLERFKAALSANARARDVAALIDDLHAELRCAEADRAAQHAIAINILSNDSDADAAADAELKAARRITRLSGQIEQLTARLAEIKTADQRRADADARAAFEAERAQLAADLRNEWPLLEARMLSLLWRVTALDAAGGRNDSAEALARGCPANFYNDGVAIPRITSMRLPTFGDCSPSAQASWPPPRDLYDRCLIDGDLASEVVAAAAARVRAIEAQA